MFAKNSKLSLTVAGNYGHRHGYGLETVVRAWHFHRIDLRVDYGNVQFYTNRREVCKAFWTRQGTRE